MIDFTLMKTCLLICTKTLLRTLSDVVSRMCGRVTLYVNVWKLFDVDDRIFA